MPSAELCEKEGRLWENSPMHGKHTKNRRFHCIVAKSMTEKEKKQLEKLIKENGYNEELQDTYTREVLDQDKEFDEDFDIDWEV